MDRIEAWIADGTIGDGGASERSRSADPVDRGADRDSFADARQALARKAIGRCWRATLFPHAAGELPAGALLERVPARTRGATVTELKPAAGRRAGRPGHRPARRARRATRVAVRQRQLGLKLEQRHQHEAPARDLGVRQGQALGRERQVAEQQHVDVDHARAVAHAAGGAADRALDRLARVKQLSGPSTSSIRRRR